MSGGKDELAREAAMDWAIRIEDPEFDDWDAHLTWLEEHHSHPRLVREASVALADGIADVGELPPLAAANDDHPDDAAITRRSHRGLLAGAVAIAATFAAVIVHRTEPVASDVAYRTQAGTTRRLTLPDGTVVTMNGNTSISVSGADRRNVTLERGEVFVEVTHDEDRPFRLLARGSVFEDVGTAFNARIDGSEISVAVREGVVAYDPEQVDIRLVAGRSIAVRARDVVLGRADPVGIGSWRTGRLVYTGTPMPRVAADLSMALGLDVRLTGTAVQSRFTGVVVLAGNDEAVMRRFAALAGEPARKDGEGWHVGARR